MNEVLKYLGENWLWISPIVLEVLTRLIPTEKDRSILHAVVKILDRLIPDIKKNPDGTISKHNGTK